MRFCFLQVLPNRACDVGVLTVLVRGPWMVLQIFHHFGRQLLCTCAVKCEPLRSHARETVGLAIFDRQTEWFWHIFLQIHLRASAGPLPPRCLTISTRCLSDASQMPHSRLRSSRRLPDATQMAASGPRMATEWLQNAGFARVRESEVYDPRWSQMSPDDARWARMIPDLSLIHI